MGIQIRGSDDSITAADGSLSVAGFAFPTSDGSASQYLQTNGAGVLSWANINPNAKIGVATAQSLTGTAVGFEGLPATTFYIQLILKDYSFSTNLSDPVFRIGDSGGYETTGYQGRAAYLGPASGGSSDITGGFAPGGAGTGFQADYHALGHLTKLTGNTWVFHAIGNYNTNTYLTLGSGVKTLSDTLDRVQFTSVSGGTFDNGTFNIIYYYTV